MKEQFIGYWRLTNWEATLDGKFHSHPFGEKAEGELLYSENGRMFASLSYAERPKFAVANLKKSTPEERKSAVDSYVSYSGTFDIVDNTVQHHVEYSLLPNWQGTDLVRMFEFSDDQETLTLSTAPEKTSSGKIIINHLIWKRIKGGVIK